MDDVSEETKISIHCGETDIYIVQNGKSKSKHARPSQETEDHTEGEAKVLGVYSPDLVAAEDKGTNGNGNGKRTIENPVRHRLMPPEHGLTKNNGKRSGKATWNLEKVSSTEYRGEQTTVGRLVDIIERERLEETIVKSQEKCRTILEEIQDAYFEVDLAGNLTTVNDSLCRLLGYPREALLGTNFRDHVAQDNAEAVYQAFNQVYQTGKMLKNLTFKVTHEDGKTVIAETSAYPLINAQGEIIGFRGIGQDVTERKRVEEALRHSEERHRTLLDAMDEDYYEVDLAGNIIFANNAICRRFGYSREELVGMNYRFFVPKEDVEDIFKTWNEVYRTGESLYSYHFANLNTGKKQVFLENSISLLRDNEGNAIGFRSICHDVTQLKQLTQKLAEATWPPLTR
jgi:PAS domain S-box-containing protein